MDKRSIVPVILGVAIAVVVLCAVCVVALLPLRQYLPFLRPEQAAPKLMPVDTALFASVNPNVQDLAGFKHLADVYGDLSEVKDASDDFSKEVEGELGISFKEDVMPWLGPEVALAITNIEALTEGADPEVIIAAATKDTRASDAFLEKLRAYLRDQGYNILEETYQGVVYYVQEVKYQWETPFVFGTVKKFVILTTDESMVEGVIDAAQGRADALAKNERYTELVAALPGDSVAYLFFDMQEMIQASLQDLEDTGVELPQGTYQQLEALQSWGLALDLDEEGIQLDFAARFDPNVLSEESLMKEGEASAHRILKRIPDDALGFISGQNLAAGWESILAAMEKTPDFEQQLEDLEDELGMRIDEDTLGWLSGEFAMAVVGTRGIEDIPVGGVAIFEIDDQKEAEDALTGIADAVEALAFLEFERKAINDVEMQVLRDPYTEEIILGYGFTANHLVIGLMEGALGVAVDDDIRSIADDETFKRVQRHLPPKTGGYFYVNVEAIWQLVYENMPGWEQEDFDETVRPFLEPIKAIGSAASPTDPRKGLGQGTLFIYIPGE